MEKSLFKKITVLVQWEKENNMSTIKNKEVNYFISYFSEIKSTLNSVNLNKLYDISNLLGNIKDSGKKVIFVGNGGSASIASHLTVDFINAANIKAINFNDPSLITCFSNDYGYENWISKALECYADSSDVLVLISSSGLSKNMLVGANKARTLGLDIVTLSGFSSNNPLKKLGDINLWVDSDAYNIVEMTHHIWLLAIVDYIILKSKEEI